MTDNEIVKALECCTTNGASCKDCPAFVKVDRSNCKKYFRGALDLINRLQEENERLKETTKNMSAYVKGNRWGLVSFVEFCKNLKAEAYKECIEKVKAENYDRCIDVVYDGSGEVKRIEIRQALFNKQLDNLLKELVGDSNEVHNSAPTKN